MDDDVLLKNLIPRPYAPKTPKKALREITAKIDYASGS